MERSIHVRLPEVMAAKMDRYAKAEGMTQSELVRQALRVFFAASVQDAAQTISQNLAASMRDEGVTEETATSWYKQEAKKRGRKPAQSGGRANCA